MTELSVVSIAFLGGLFPALAWLFFWTREDAKNPEPRRLLALAFLAGMITVGVVIPIQKWSAAELALATTATFALWSTIEEIFKYLAARITVLRSRENNEPIDAVIYMVTVALGFAAVENALFIIAPLTNHEIISSVLTGNLRFVGASLVHVLSSALVGVALALTFYKPRRIRRLAAFVGVILAAALHTSFNILILNTQDEYLLRTFSFVWIGIIALLATLEYIKRMRRIPRKR